MFSIREAGITDIPLIRKLTFQLWPQTFASILTQEQIDYMLELMYSEDSLKRQMEEEKIKFIFIYEGDEAVGFAAYNEMKEHIFKLHKIYVLPSRQGKGSGKFMMDFIINEIKQKGAVALQLQVNRYNRAKNFYEKLGFTVIGEEDFDIGNGYFMNDYIMEKQV